MTNSVWLERFPNVVVTHLPHSDHYPLTLNLKPLIKTKPKQIRIESMWLNLSSFNSIVSNHRPSNSQNYPQSINQLTTAIQSWKYNVFNNIFGLKKKILARLKGIQSNLQFTC